MEFIRISVCILVLLFISTCAFTQSSFPVDFHDWVRQRVGPVVYPERSSQTWDDYLDLATKLGTRAVKTWASGTKPGEMVERIQAPHYLALIHQFPVVHFNLCQAYITDGLQPGRIAPEILKAAEKDWYDITLFLCQESRIPEQIFLLSICGELNVYMGTQGSNPDFPVVDYVNACHRGKEAALAAFQGDSKPQVYSVAELQGDKEFERCAKEWVPHFETDLVGLSHYTFYMDVLTASDIIRRNLKPLGPFGKDRLMLGEYGPTMQVSNWNQAAQMRWHDEILRQAYEMKHQFAFFYELADHDYVIAVSGHDGLVSWSPGPVPRLIWHYYHSIYQGEIPSFPDYDLYEVRNRISAVDPASASPNLVIVDLLTPEPASRAGDAVVFSASIQNTGNAPSNPTSVNFHVNDRMVSWAGVPALEPGEKTVITSTQSDDRFVWIALEGLHRLTARVDSTNLNQELRKDDNVLEQEFRVWPAVSP